MNPIEMTPTISTAKFLWISGLKNHPDYFIGWNGFMEQITDYLKYDVTKTNFLPFVNAIPSNYDTIYIYGPFGSRNRPKTHICNVRSVSLFQSSRNFGML